MIIFQELFQLNTFWVSNKQHIQDNYDERCLEMSNVKHLTLKKLKNIFLANKCTN
jgi:hypothetical protein